MRMVSQHLLSVILFTPAVGAVVLLFTPSGALKLHRLVGNAFGVLGFLISLPLVVHFPSGFEGYAFLESSPWIPSIGARYSLGLDGISLLLVMLSTLLGMLAMLSSWSAVQIRAKEYYILLLLLQTGVLGVFMALDGFLFYLFWEVVLVPMYFLIAVWGGDRRLYAAFKVFLYTSAGSVLMLLSILALSFNAAKVSGVQTFSIPTLLAAAQNFPDSLKVWIFWGFFFAFAIKVPLFPFHTWLPDAHTEASTATSIVLAGVLLKMGAYGFIRFSLPLLPADPAPRSRIIHILIVLSLIGILYGAIVSLMQKDIKRLIAYSSISQMGLCTLGIFALTPTGLSGSVLQQINHGISTGALVLMFGILYERRRTRLISEFGGLATPMPGFAILYFIATLGALGMPLLNGFIGEFAILQGVFVVDKAWAAWSVLGLLLGAASLLWLYQRTTFGSVTHERNKTLGDLNLREYAILLPLIAIAFWIGIYPKPFFDFINGPVDKIVHEVNPAFYRQRAAVSFTSSSSSTSSTSSTPPLTPTK
jgi:NADH-quinone oxidoreductase subunit M